MKVNASYHTLRRLLGELGLLLPIILYLGNGLVVEPSISDFFYTRMGTVFTGVLIAFGLFLFTYRGHDKDPNRKEWISDNRVTNIAGALAMLTALIPTSFSPGEGRVCAHVLCSNSGSWGTVHLVCAAGFLLIMGLIAIFKFTLGPKEGANKWKHPFYRITGIIVVISLVFMALYIFLKWEEKMGLKNGVFYAETIALFAFGSAWLVKGDIRECWILKAMK